MNDNKPLFSQTHFSHPDFTTRIQIGTHRFKKIESVIDWISLFIFRPKLSKDNFEIIRVKIKK